MNFIRSYYQSLNSTEKIQISLLLLIFFMLCCVLPFTVIALEDSARNRTWREYEKTPLPTEVVAYLCDEKMVPEDIADCVDTYPQLTNGDLPEIMKQHLLPDQTSYQEVTELIGKYETKCKVRTDMMEDRTVNYCVYDMGANFSILFDTDDAIIISVDYVEQE